MDLWRVTSSGECERFERLAWTVCGAKPFDGRVYWGRFVAVAKGEMSGVGWWTRRSQPQGPSNPWVHKLEGDELGCVGWDRSRLRWLPCRDWRSRQKVAWHGRYDSVASRSSRLW